MEVKINIKNPFVLAIAVVALVAGGAWFGWKHPEKFKQIVRSNYDRDAIIDVEKMRASLDDNMMLFLRSALLRAAADKGNIEEQTSSIENDVDIRLLYRIGDVTGKATADAQLSRGNNWTLYSVELVP